MIITDFHYVQRNRTTKVTLVFHWVSKHLFPVVDEAQVCSIQSLISLDNLTLSL